MLQGNLNDGSERRKIILLLEMISLNPSKSAFITSTMLIVVSICSDMEISLISGVPDTGDTQSPENSLDGGTGALHDQRSALRCSEV
jgi:hypothetical protein